MLIKKCYWSRKIKMASPSRTALVMHFGTPDKMHELPEGADPEEYIEIPDDWVWCIKDGRAANNTETGRFHLSRAGWIANYEEIKTSMEEGYKDDPGAFPALEAEALEFFKRMEHAFTKQIGGHMSEVERLRRYLP